MLNTYSCVFVLTILSLFSCKSDKDVLPIISSPTISQHTIIADSLKELRKNGPYFSIDSVIIIVNNEISSKLIYHNDIVKGFDTLVMSYVYDTENNNYNFSGATVTNSANEQAIINSIAEENNGIQSKNISVNVIDTSLNKRKETLYKIDQTTQKFNISNSVSKKYVNNKLKYIDTQYGENKSQIAYKYQDTLLLNISAYALNETTPKLSRLEEFIYNDNGLPISHKKSGLSNDETQLILFNRTDKRYNARGELVKIDYYERQQTDGSELYLAGVTQYKYDSNGRIQQSDVSYKNQGMNYTKIFKYDQFDNCIEHDIERRDDGYKYEKLKFDYDDNNRIIKYIVMNNNSDGKVYDTVSITQYSYHKDTNLITGYKRGKSSSELVDKLAFEYDQYGNIKRRIVSGGKTTIDYHYDYDVKRENVHSDTRYLEYNIKNPKLSEYGLSWKDNRVKMKHALVKQTQSTNIGTKSERTKTINFHYSPKK